MGTVYPVSSPVNTPPALRLVSPQRTIQDEEAPPYDVGQVSAPRTQRKPRVNDPWVKYPVRVLKDTTLGPWARLAYPLLLNYRSERGIFPGRERLAVDLGVSIPTVDRALNELCAAGLIVKQRQGRGHTNRYVLPDESSPVMTHTDDLSPVTSQTDESSDMTSQTDESSDMTSQDGYESSPVRSPESSPVMTPLKEVEQDPVEPELTPPLSPDAEPEQKPKTIPPDFVEFWAKYPARNGRKSTKAESLDRWREMTKGDRAAALDAVDAYARSDEAIRGFAVDAIRWLKRRRWTDEVAPTEPRRMTGWTSA